MNTIDVVWTPLHRRNRSLPPGRRTRRADRPVWAGPSSRWARTLHDIVNPGTCRRKITALMVMIVSVTAVLVTAVLLTTPTHASTSDPYAPLQPTAPAQAAPVAPPSR